MILRRSAFKYGIAEADSVEAASWPQFTAPLDDEHPQRELRLGFDTHGRLLELVVLVWDDGTEEIIHSMKARKKYLDLLP
ncbi:MAG TPA: toxin [Candidatus Corynebacterium avicola]|uniref:Toxin n=1 Tax=Candidatus Corynebacterium avicola TaxID=2838527 RepID=A0A9D1RPK1_9CORY|nr:toxin [Candidatus Corynebacterium avicola]